jgi:hypothetical protein
MIEDDGVQYSPTLDERVAEFLGRRSQKLSRRGAMVSMGRVLLRVSGLALLPLLPSVACNSGGTCGWTTCGMCGNFCSTSGSCCSGSGGVAKCPNCLSVGGSWTFCCYDPTTCNCQAGFVFTYTDCMSNTSGLALTCRDSTRCSTPPTGNCAGQGGYAYGSTFYACTIVVQGGPCNACHNGVQP